MRESERSASVGSMLECTVLALPFSLSPLRRTKESLFIYLSGLGCRFDTTV